MGHFTVVCLVAWPLNDSETGVDLNLTAFLIKSVLISMRKTWQLFFLQDYHCHLTNSEVVGYLAGKFDPQSHRKCAWGLEFMPHA